MKSQSTPLQVIDGLPAPRRSTERPVPQTSPEHAHLGLEALRAYRKALTAEERQVSYWRRIIQGRLDVVRAGSALDSGHLRGALADARHNAVRIALIEVLPVDDLPSMPDLDALWDRQVLTDDEPGRRVLAADLERAEAQLSDYRRTLHVRVGAVTAELIARYREEPALCMCALPLGPGRRSVPA